MAVSQPVIYLLFTFPQHAGTLLYKGIGMLPAGAAAPVSQVCGDKFAAEFAPVFCFFCNYQCFAVNDGLFRKIQADVE